MKKISVIVPIYNKELDLRKCLDSLINQTHKNMEIILIDDKSTDNSRKIIKEYSTMYPQIKALYNKVNKGIGYTRNKGLKSATGDYIGFVDSDDYIHKTMYAEHLKFMEDNKLDLVTSNFIKVFTDKEMIFKHPYFKVATIKEDPSIINKVNYGTANKLFKTKIIKDNQILFDESTKYEDMIFVCKYIKNSNKIGYLNKELYYYVIHDKSETNVMDKRVFDMFKVMDLVNKEYSEIEELTSELEYLNINQITRYMLQQRKQKNRKLKNKFIEDGYNYLSNNYPNWKKNKIYKKTNKLKKIIKNNKVLMNIYVNI